MFRVPRRSLFVSIAATLGLAVLPSAAGAGVLVDSATECSDASASQVFLPWIDPAFYVLAPGGDFETGDGWSASGASVVSGNEPWNVVGDNDHKSLRIPADKSATSPSMCVGVEHPTLRFFARSSGTGLLSSMRVEALYENNLGLLEALPIGLVLPNGSWAATSPMAVLANLLPLLPGERTAVAFRFVPQGSGSWQIDDVHVDPWYTR
jgi:hypothetical protein